MKCHWTAPGGGNSDIEVNRVTCDWMNPPQQAMDLWFRADDDGIKHPVLGECKNDNALLFLPSVVCGQIG